MQMPRESSSLSGVSSPWARDPACTRRIRLVSQNSATAELQARARDELVEGLEALHLLRQRGAGVCVVQALLERVERGSCALDFAFPESPLLRTSALALDERRDAI